MKTTELRNWKLKEVAKHIEIVASDSIERRNELLDELNLPRPDNITGMNRVETNIDWPKMPEYHKFFFDKEGWEEPIKLWFEKSSLISTSNLVITYGWKEPMIKIPTKIFIKDWEDFFQSTKYETIIFSEDYKLIMEVSRDYYLHSNFPIQTE
jgi:hypothetical protein